MCSCFFFFFFIIVIMLFPEQHFSCITPLVLGGNGALSWSRKESVSGTHVWEDEVYCRSKIKGLSWVQLWCLIRSKATVQKFWAISLVQVCPHPVSVSAPGWAPADAGLPYSGSHLETARAAWLLWKENLGTCYPVYS